ncbi:putative F-box domain, leucine-rich repeat domain superfamily, F-box-like domain superfamily [Helianthus debilis subsp. tardiflorus]
MDDRLSGLSDDLLLKILSFVRLKDAVRSSVLSPRWRYLWTSLPTLTLSIRHFKTIHNLSNFVTHLLSLRNNQLPLSSFDLFLRVKHDHHFVVGQRIINHAFSFNVDHVNISCLYGTGYDDLKPRLVSLPGSQTLKRLTLSRPPCPCDEIVLTSAQEFSSLTTLHLRFVSFYDGFLSMCPNLENLTLLACKVTGSDVSTICHPRLSNLTLEKRDAGTRTINVVTPQLKNLIVLNYNGVLRVSAPELASLLVRGPCPLEFSTDGFPCLEKALLDFDSVHLSSAYDNSRNLSNSYASTIISLLQEFHCVKLLSLSMEIIELLNSYVELISHQPSPLANLETLRLLPKSYDLWQTRFFVSTEVKSYLLSRSPKATLTEVPREERNAVI